MEDFTCLVPYILYLIIYDFCFCILLVFPHLNSSGNLETSALYYDTCNQVILLIMATFPAVVSL